MTLTWLRAFPGLHWVLHACLQRGASYWQACRTQGKPGNALNHVMVMPLDQGGHEHFAIIIQNILMIWNVDSNIIKIIKYLFNELTEAQMLLIMKFNTQLHIYSINLEFLHIIFVHDRFFFEVRTQYLHLVEE